MANMCRLLLIEPDPVGARLITKGFIDASLMDFQVAHVRRVDQALSIIDHGELDAVVFSTPVLDSEELEIARDLAVRLEDVPLVVVANGDDEASGVQALRCGAQDYITRGSVEYGTVVRSVVFALERQRRLAGSRPLQLLDEETGLYNEAGFQLVGERYLRLGERNGRSMFFSLLNVATPHPETNGRAAEGVASLLQDTFRSSDILGRLGKAEFAALGMAGVRNTDVHICARLDKNIARLDLQRLRDKDLTIRKAVFEFRPSDHPTLRNLIATARDAVGTPGVSDTQI